MVFVYIRPNFARKKALNEFNNYLSKYEDILNISKSFKYMPNEFSIKNYTQNLIQVVDELYAYDVEDKNIMSSYNLFLKGLEVIKPFYNTLDSDLKQQLEDRCMRKKLVNMLASVL
jgi:hypothetical protein